MAAKKVNKRGWWGILIHATWPTLIAVAITGGIFGIAKGTEAGWSATVPAGKTVRFVTTLKK